MSDVTVSHLSTGDEAKKTSKGEVGADISSEHRPHSDNKIPA